ncbi:hypothetical protein K1719_005977 [Acacia pycnantha]|nr:hypothetical protein K1719_005977 [Acacia pycnantha]
MGFEGSTHTGELPKCISAGHLLVSCIFPIEWVTFGTHGRKSLKGGMREKIFSNMFGSADLGFLKNHAPLKEAVKPLGIVFSNPYETIAEEHAASSLALSNSGEA